MSVKLEYDISVVGEDRLRKTLRAIEHEVGTKVGASRLRNYLLVLLVVQVVTLGLQIACLFH